MITALLIVGAWGFFLAVILAFFVGACHDHAPKPPISPEEIIWLRAAAKVAHRRAS